MFVSHYSVFLEFNGILKNLLYGEFDSLVLDVGGKVRVSPSDIYSCVDMS